MVAAACDLHGGARRVHGLAPRELTMDDDEIPEEAPADGTLAWRFMQLKAVGFDIPTAMLLAGEPGVDVHRICEAVAAGCSVELAVQIFT